MLSREAACFGFTSWIDPGPLWDSLGPFSESGWVCPARCPHVARSEDVARKQWPPEAFGVSFVNSVYNNLLASKLKQGVLVFQHGCWSIRSLFGAIFLLTLMLVKDEISPSKQLFSSSWRGFPLNHPILIFDHPHISHRRNNKGTHGCTNLRTVIDARAHTYPC